MIEYSEGGGFDIYEHGDIYGHRLEINFDGEYWIYKRIYQGNRATQDTVIAHDTLSSQQTDRIYSALKKYQFYSYPSRIPQGGPNETRLRTPAESVTITARLTPTDTLKTVRAKLGGDTQFYPEHFFDLRELLRDTLNQLK
jgi:predicted type IV restriction endonuclease